MSLPLAIGEVFPFFSDVSNLERITPPELCFQILTPQPIAMGEGRLIDLRLRLLRIPFGWQTRIALWNPPHQFVDEQLRGPYRLWIHTHSFSEENGSTTIADEVQYQLPLWPIGEVARPLVRAQLQRIFLYREEATRAALLGPGGSSAPIGDVSGPSSPGAPASGGPG
jgi:ligand-binding SRPBCC domain-containing protein